MSDKIQQDLKELQKIDEEVLFLAKQNGATSADVCSALDDGFAVNVRMGALDTVEYHRDKAVGITVYFGHRKGVVSISDTSKSSLEKAVLAACNIAKYTEEDPFSGLADEALMATHLPDLKLYHPWNISPDVAIDRALECEKYARNLDQRIVNSEGVSCSSHQHAYVYANSNGFIAGVPSTTHGINCAFIAEQDGQMERDGDYDIARESSELKDFHRLADKAVERVLNRLGARKLTTRKVPVILTPEMSQGFLSTLIAAISGGNLYRKSSFLCDHLHQQVCSNILSIKEKPYLINGLGSSAFDAEGVQTVEKDFVKEGVLTSYVLGSYSARKLKMETTANAGGVHNLILEGNKLPLNELVKKMDTGLIAVELIGQGINLVTGDYSQGVVGLWVEHGEIQHPISEMTLSGNLKDIFFNIVALGDDIETHSNIQTGSMLLDKLTLAGN